MGFQVAGYELALDPNADPATGPLTCWGVPDVEVTLARLLAAGATPHEAVRDVGGDIRVATVLAAAGTVLGIIENPHVALSEPASVAAGPGR